MTRFRLAGVAIATLILSTALAQAASIIELTRGSDGPTILSRDGGDRSSNSDDSTPFEVTTKPSLQTRQFLVMALGCEVAGAPGELPDDLLLVNQGTETLAAGTNIKWQIKGTKLKGYLALTADLAAGAGVRADGVLEGGVEAGLLCAAKVI